MPRLAFWVEPRLPGAALDRGQREPGHAALARLLPALLRLNDAQEGLGTGPPRWRSLITRTLASGGDGYCLHATLQASPHARDLLPVLRRIADRCGPAIPDGQTRHRRHRPWPGTLNFVARKEIRMEAAGRQELPYHP